MNRESGMYDLDRKLRSMKLSEMANSLMNQIDDPNSDLLSFDERFSQIVNAEWDARYNKKLNRFIKKATLKYPSADLDETIYDPQRLLDTKTIEALATCNFIDEKRNLLITGSTGSGKTYFSNALALSALKKFKTVRYLKASTLIHEVEAAEADSSYLRYINGMAALDLLIIDDFGLMELDIDKCRNLFEVIDTREVNASTCMISQFPISSWYEMFHNNTYADACMDRLIHKAYRLEFNGKNMRNPNHQK